MEIKEFEFSLRDGRRAVIRSPREEDVPGMIEYLKITAADTDFVIRCPEECSRYTPEGEKELISLINSSNCRAMPICVVDGKVVGVAEVSWSNMLKVRHRAELAIAVVEDHWDLGIGTRLFQELIRVAEENKNILLLELDFIEGNTRARAFYEGFGFRVVGINPDAIRMRDGTFRNILTMKKKVER